MTVWWGKRPVNKQRGNWESGQNLRRALEECGLHSDGTGASQADVEGARLEGGRQTEGTFLCYLRDRCHITPALLRDFSSERSRVRCSQQAARRGTGAAAAPVIRLHHYTLYTPGHTAIQMRRRQRRDKWSKAN